MKLDRRFACHGVEEDALQIGAMNNAIGGTPAALGIGERHKGEVAAIARGAHPHAGRLRRDGDDGIEHAEPPQDARGVGRKLHAGSDRLQLRRLLEQRDGRADPCQGERGGQTANSGAGDQETRR